MQFNAFFLKSFAETKKIRTFAPTIKKQTQQELQEQEDCQDKQSGCSAVGSVPGLGPGCRRFESCHPDKSHQEEILGDFFYSRFSAVFHC